MKTPQEIVVRPLVTEKGTWMMEENNQYAFEVSRSANKIEIRKAIESLWDVTVVAVRTQNLRGKTVSRSTKTGRFTGKRRNWKKAVVTLAEGDSIDLFEGVV